MKSNIIKKTTPILFILIGMIVVSVLSSCTKNRNDIIIDLGDVNNGNGNSNDTTSSNKQKSLISFSASVESVTQSKSMTALPANRYSMIWAYNASKPMSDGIINRLLFKSEKPGTLSPVSGPMYLPNGNYNFYSVTTNSSINQNPNFNSDTGISASNLSNGIDYLWWGSSNVSIQKTTVNIPIIYSHSATQVVIKLIAGNGIVLNSQTAGTITPSNPASITMNLQTGIINPATSLDSKAIAMGVSNFVSQLTMLPLTMSGKLTTTFTVLINNETVPRVYSVNIPVPSGGLAPGKSYLYKAIVNANEITFSSVNVIDWIVVDEQGTPLYPTQIQ